MFITMNTTEQKERKYLTMRLCDILDGNKPKEEPSAEEIIQNIRRRVEGGQ